MSIAAVRHPEFNALEEEWKKFRLTYEGGRDFIDKYTETFSKREDSIEFIKRRKMTYCPAHAKTAVNEIKDAISERLIDVVRVDGPLSYQKAIEGLNGGVDRDDSTMNGFISCSVIPELLSMGRVGVYVDRPQLPENASRADVVGTPPYLYTYKAEDILSWDYDEDNELKLLLLKEEIFDYDVKTNLPKGTKTRYRYLERTEDGVKIRFYDQAGVEQVIDELTLKIKTIPFALFKIRHSLLTDIADYQIALLNLGSSDLSYAIKANFPFYTEQYDPREFALNMLQAGDVEDANGNLVSAGTETEANTPKNNEVRVGVTQGRRYPRGLDRPDFIHPSSEPLEASMQKQKDLQAEIRELSRLAVKSLASSSEGSKIEDNRSVESGLATIGAELEKGERKIGRIWAEYEESSAPIIKYPKNYTLRTDSERRIEAKELEEHIAKTPSITAQKLMTKQVANILLGHRASQDDLRQIFKEIDSAEVIITDPEVIRADHEAGLVGTALASKLRGYPEGEVEQAKKDHAERIERIAMAQSKYSIDKLKVGDTSSDRVDGARGVNDLDPDSDTAKNEKKLSRNTDMDDTVTDKTRGAANG